MLVFSPSWNWPLNSFSAKSLAIPPVAATLPANSDDSDVTSRCSVLPARAISCPSLLITRMAIEFESRCSRSQIAWICCCSSSNITTWGVPIARALLSPVVLSYQIGMEKSTHGATQRRVCSHSLTEPCVGAPGQDLGGVVAGRLPGLRAEGDLEADCRRAGVQAGVVVVRVRIGARAHLADGGDIIGVLDAARVGRGAALIGADAAAVGVAVARRGIAG